MKDNFHQLVEIAFTILLPFTALLASVVIFLSFLIYGPPALPPALEPIITDGHFQTKEQIAFFQNQPVSPLPQPVDVLEAEEKKVLAGQTSRAADKEKWIEIDLTKQQLLAHENGRIVWKFPISSGKWAPTPTGEFRIWAKLKYTLMTGGSKHDDTYYYLPNVPYTQYFHHGFGIHGTYWHNNFGQPMSHGCINMYTPDAEKLFYWTDPAVKDDQWIVYPRQTSGTRVVVHGRPQHN